MKNGDLLCNYDICPKISEEEKKFLQRSFDEQEVLGCLKMCAVDKAPGPDGYTMFSIIINGSPEGFSPTHRGLRQGDPLSPFLFIIVMECLNNMVKKTKSNGWIKGFEVARSKNNSLEITHLQYADDTLIFCDAEKEQLRFLRVILVLFEGISGLHVNWKKSHLYPINEVPDMEQLALILGGEVETLPTVYLGMPLGAKSKSKEIWNNVIKKGEKKLSR
ncbi:putative mitochondrial protein AtMg01250 [Nicotiana tabacum]|uniref:Mitochondrial protein AtMg01250 n=1 Tax=Nicotiana tabacum TaxID=4097 RepID=A0AC58SS12_TOBAC